MVKVVVDYKAKKDRGDNVELQATLASLQWYWARQQQHKYHSDLNKRDQKKLKRWQLWLSPCEDIADTQVQYMWR